MNKNDKKDIKKRMTRAIGSEDAIILEMTRNYSLDEATSIYDSAMSSLGDSLGDHEALFAKSLLAIGFGQYVRSVANRRLEEAD